VFALVASCTTAQTPEAVGARAPAASAPIPAAGPSESAVSARTTPPGEDPNPPLAAPSSAAAPSLSPPRLAPLSAETDLAPLAVTGFRDAIVSVPNGATEPRPVVLALHGNFDRPEWQCEVWRGITRARAFVVCPRGVPRPDAPKSLDRWTYGKGTDVRAEIEAALAALRTRFSGYVAEGPILYAGFSLGAIHGVGIVASDGQRYPRAVLVEGGHDGWTPARAKSFAAAGGKRVLFACGQRACKTEAASARKNLEREGITTQLVFGGEVGHTYDGPVAAEIARVFSWLVADDPRFAE
jgi:predicted esterase